MNATNFIVAGDNIYLRDWSVLSKLDLTTMEQTQVGTFFSNSSNSQYRETLAYANDKLFYIVRDYVGGQDQSRIYSRDNSGQVTELYSEQSDQIFRLAVDSEENIYVLRGWNEIYKVVGNELEMVLDLSNGWGNIYDIKCQGNALYAHIYYNDINAEQIILVQSGSRNS